MSMENSIIQAKNSSPVITSHQQVKGTNSTNDFGEILNNLFVKTQPEAKAVSQAGEKTGAVQFQPLNNFVPELPSTVTNASVIPGRIMAIRKYKDDQLLSNPGGDYYYLKPEKAYVDQTDQKSFITRTGKDIADSFGNIKNFFSNLLFGAERHYRNNNNEIEQVKEKGVLGSAISFLKNIGSALTFGLYNPDKEEAPKGFGERCKFFYGKIKEAVFGDLIEGVSGGMLRMGEDLMLSGLNMVETIPDATIGNFKAGRALTTEVFDNTQVILDYLTDIMPSGEAWVRVHSGKPEQGELPVLSNLKRPEKESEDSRWKYVSNTGFRKGVETIGALMMDILSLDFLGESSLFSDNGKKRQ